MLSEWNESLRLDPVGEDAQLYWTHQHFHWEAPKFSDLSECRYLFFSSTIIFLCFRFIISPFRIYSKWSCFPFFFLPPCLHPKRHFPAFLFPTFIMKLAHVQKNWKNGTVNNTHMLYTLIPTYTFFFAMLFKTKWWCVTSQYTLWPASREKGHFLYQHNTIMTPKKTSQSIFRFLHLSQ